jgi:hypothetical protein
MVNIKEFQDAIKFYPSDKEAIDQKLIEIRKKISQNFSDVLDGGLNEFFNKFIDDLHASS